ncbi:YMGG-like glycine zipper-containing protein [Mucilaginibacter sp.]|uniref:YMGG-like glycine zipper-containing protein n=1 Tax=Mucilaginibacter sp. TaxID=1882438 RepID=UPI003D0C2EC3
MKKLIISASLMLALTITAATKAHAQDHKISPQGKGAIIGGAGGAVAGGIIGHGVKGAVIGGALGAGGGYIIGNEKRRRDEKRRAAYRRAHRHHYHHTVTTTHR